MGHEKEIKYRLICGDQKSINDELLPAAKGWKPILMSTVTDPQGGISFAVMLERTAIEY